VPLYELGNTFNIKLIVVDHSVEHYSDAFYSSRITLTKVRLKELLFTQFLLVNELSLYKGTQIIQRCVKELILCSNLKYDNSPRISLPVSQHKRLYFSCQLSDINFLADVLHHELFHMIEYEYYHSLCSLDLISKDRQLLSPLSPKLKQKTVNDFIDSEWESLNEKDFEYGEGGASVRSPAAFLPTSNQSALDGGIDSGNFRGFLNYYSQSAAEEDKAEIYAHLICRYEFVSKNKDEIIRAKAELIKKRLFEFDSSLKELKWFDRVTQHKPYSKYGELQVHAQNKSVVPTDQLEPANLSIDIPNSGSDPTSHSSSTNGWIECRDPNSGYLYWINKQTSQAQWIKPE